MKRGRVFSALLLFSLSACSFGGGAPKGFVVEFSAGVAQVKRVGTTTFDAIKRGVTVSPGDAVRVSAGGSLTLKRGPESFIRLRPYDEAQACAASTAEDNAACLADAAPPLSAEATIVGVERVRVAAGDVLVRSLPSARIAVESNGVDATSTEGTFRFDRRLSLRVAVYEGSATVSAAGVILELPSLREGVVAGRELPRQPTLLQYHATDPWDRELLKDVIDLDSELVAQRRGYEGEFGRKTAPDDVEGEMEALQEIAGDADVSFIRRSIASHRKGDVLIGVVFCLLLEESGKGTASDHYDTVLASVSDGASWGFLTRDRGVVPGDLLSAVVRAIGLRTGEVEAGTVLIPEPSAAPTGSGTARPSPKPTSSKSSTPKPSPSPSKSSTPKPSPSPSPSPSESPTCTPIGPICVGEGQVSLPLG